ncbi:uncharacterized protein Z518_09871 [Rhinocladiella mackenziei CBS 650.93]|uniref:AB hydrolase-1 domain-containing protein n=1 Tax=Rhinocladiella mackenziei CBS 650.93 TaxID=1442369 RepID=A0A0D2IC17_9EURO|nr:uncharacterized protein Z518_09871 [Rhinocladiella mackenziei CBS 650.93]KIX00806.1 hypothetical protein Z518_09871 [Rhinocladiella mackenziei CBS 650.93]
MPSVPPFSRSENVSDYATQCKPVIWTEHDLRASDGTALKLLEGHTSRATNFKFMEHIIIVYFQGNASSLPPRLPYLSSILKSAMNKGSKGQKYTIAALSYRGFWKSKGRPSQAGIELDAEAALRWVLAQYDRDRTKIVVWGQSIGAGVATIGLANLSRDGSAGLSRISGVILETPFVDLRAMLVALYPQKFLPYRYLTPFLRSTWDSKTALHRIGKTKPTLRILILEAGDDEIVPSGQAAILEEACKKELMMVDRKVVPGALHTEVMIKGQGRSHIVQFLQSF